MRNIAVVLLILSCTVVVPSHATVLTGPIVDFPDSTRSYPPPPPIDFCWGDSIHVLCEIWHSDNSDSLGWFWGCCEGDVYYSNVEVYVYPGLTDPTTIADAESFTYEHGWIAGREGDTVFFRGVSAFYHNEGFYGAWRIDAIDRIPDHPPWSNLNGQWYFQDNGTGCFAEECDIPTAKLTWGSLKALYQEKQ